MLHGRIQTAGQSDLFAQIRTERGRVQRDPIGFLGFKPPNVDQQKIVKCVLVLFVLLFLLSKLPQIDLNPSEHRRGPAV